MSAIKQIDVSTLKNSVFAMSSRISSFVMVGKVINLGCVIRNEEKELDCGYPCKYSFVLRFTV
jgi:hypothetical protein